MNFNQAKLFSEFLLGPGIPFALSEGAIHPRRSMQGSSEAQVELFVANWVETERRADTTALLATLTEDFVGVGPRGFMLDKNAWLERYTTGALHHEIFDLDEMRVRLYSDSAIVTGRLVIKSKHQGRAIQGIFRVSLMVVREGEELLLAGLHLSAMAAEG